MKFQFLLYLETIKNHRHISLNLTYIRCFSSFVKSIMGFVIFFGCIGGIFAEQDNGNQLRQLRLAYKEAIQNDNLKEAYYLLDKMSEIHENSFRFDSVLIYHRRESKIGEALDSPQKIVQPLIDNLNIEYVISKGIKNYNERVDSLYKYVDDTRVLPLSRAYILRHKASTLRYQEEDAQAILLMKKAIGLFNEPGFPVETKTSFQLFLAKLYNFNEQYVECLNILTTVDREISIEKDAILKSRVYKELYDVLLKIRDYDKAYDYAEESLELGKSQNRVEIIAEAYQLMGVVKYHKKEYVEAIDLINQAIEQLNNTTLNNGLINCYQKLALIYLDSEEMNMAGRMLDSAYHYQSFGEGESYKEINTRLAFRYNLGTGKLKKAGELLAKINSNLGSTDYFKYLYHKERGDKLLALKHYENYTHEVDSIMKATQIMQVHHLESGYNREKQELEINNLSQITTAQDKALAIRNTALVIGGIMLLALLALLFGLYHLFNKNKRNQKILATQNLQISKALDQNKILIKEIHHRVKNNLQVVSSLLSMQARKIEDGNTKDALNSSRTRVQSMSILHQNLFQGENLKAVDVDEYLEEVINNIVETYKKDETIDFKVDIDKMSLDIDTLVPIGLIVNELVCNAVKYAFPNSEKGQILVAFKLVGEDVVLTVQDSGVGIIGDTLPAKEGSLGARLIHSFTKTLDGDIEINGSAGTQVIIRFSKDSLGLNE